MKYLGNAFSINMLDVGRYCIVQVKRIEMADVPHDCKSIIGHPATASLLTKMLGYDVPVNRESVMLKKDDELYVAQYSGPRLPEGATELPEGAQILFFRVKAEKECCAGCSAFDCNNCPGQSFIQGY